VTDSSTEDANGEIDENFWAQAAADRVDFDETADPGEQSTHPDGQKLMDSPGDNAPIPFESQFFHDDVDDAFVDDQLDGGSPGMMMDIPGDEDDLWAGTQGQELKKSRPENVHFAKKAKRVDVKRLKDDIWSGLKTLVPDTEGQTESEDETVRATTRGSDDQKLRDHGLQLQPTTPTKDVAPVKTFDAIIQNLRTTYPQEKMSEISTSFCFICLLHLANEEGLMIETARYDGQELEDVGCVGVAEIPEDAEEMENGELMAKWRKMAKRMDQGEKTDRIVGELQALKVYKDPTAGRAA
jgi:condensin complex subunit 2